MTYTRRVPVEPKPCCCCGVLMVARDNEAASEFASRSTCGRKCADTVRGQLKRTHGHYVGGKPSPERSSWNSMMKRCYSPKSNRYHLYGARGITVCERWHDFMNFLADMGRRPVGTSLDRINNDGNYEPANCRWADAKTQRLNGSRVIRIGGIPLEAFLPKSLVTPQLVRQRLHKGVPLEEALTKTPRMTLKTAFGVTKRFCEWLRDQRCVATKEAIRARIRRGWSFEEAITTPSARLQMELNDESVN